MQQHMEEGIVKRIALIEDGIEQEQDRFEFALSQLTLELKRRVSVAQQHLDEAESLAISNLNTRVSELDSRMDESSMSLKRLQNDMLPREKEAFISFFKREISHLRRNTDALDLELSRGFSPLMKDELTDALRSFELEMGISRRDLDKDIEALRSKIITKTSTEAVQTSIAPELEALMIHLEASVKAEIELRVTSDSALIESLQHNSAVLREGFKNLA